MAGLTLEQKRALAVASARAAATSGASSHREFDGSNIPGYNPETGMVERDGGAGLAGVTSAIEGMPVVGPFARQGVEAVSASIGSALTGQPFEQVRGEMSGMVDEAQAAHPIASTVGGVGGAVLGTAPMVMAAPAAFGAGGGGLLARTLASMGSGAALGGADAGVRSGGDMEAIKSGTIWGGGLGALGPAVGKAVGAGTNALASRLGGGSGAERAFSRAAGADAIDDIGARLAATGPDALPMDLGPNLQRQAGALAATPGRGQEVVRSAIAARQAGSGGRVAGALDDALGQSVDTVALADDIIAKRSEAAKPLYDAAYSKPVDFTTDLESLLKRPSVGKALSKAKSLAADEGIASKQWFATVSDDGAVNIVNTPDMRQLDLTKRALDDMISTAQRGGNNNEARILTQTKNQLVDMMDKAAPEYKQARTAFSGPSAVIDALEEGRTAFKGNLSPNELRTRMMKMGEAEKEAYTQGARTAVADIMGTARNDALAARNTFMKGYNKEKLELIVGKDQAAKMLKSLEAETAFTNTRDVVTGNSETAARLAAQQEVGAGTKQPGLIRSFDISKPGDVLARMSDKVLGGARSAAQNKLNEELARLLTGDPASATRAINMVQAAQKRGDISAARAREIIQSMNVGAAQEGQRRRPIAVGR